MDVNLMNIYPFSKRMKGDKATKVITQAHESCATADSKT